VFANF